VTNAAFSRTFLNQVSHIATCFVTGRVASCGCCPHHPDKAGFPPGLRPCGAMPLLPVSVVSSQAGMVRFED